MKNSQNTRSAKSVKTATRKLSIEVDAHTLGFLTTASVIHNCTVEQAASRFLNSPVICDWANENYVLN